MPRQHRAAAILAVIAGMCAAAAACSADADTSAVQYGALAMVSGKPTAVVVTCGEKQIMVTLRTPVDQENRTLMWSVVVTVPDGASSVDVELLGQPRPGWAVVPAPTGDGGGRGPDVDALTSIDEGQQYVLDAARPKSTFQEAPLVTFTSADLARIGPGEVLAATAANRLEVIPRESFQHQTRCD